MDPPVSHNVSVYRATQDTHQYFRLKLRDSHPLRSTFPDLSPSASISYMSPTTPPAVTNGLGFSAFARHYSQNLLFSSSYLDVSVRTVPLPLLQGMTWIESRRVSPFGYLRLTRSYTPHRSFSQYNTSFFGTRYLGILCVPLVAFRIYHTKSPTLLACDFSYYLRVDYSTVKTHSLRFLPNKNPTHHSTSNSISPLHRRKQDKFRLSSPHCPRPARSVIRRLLITAPHTLRQV